MELKTRTIQRVCVYCASSRQIHVAYLEERFMDQRHGAMWSLVDSPENVIEAIRKAPAWDSSARKFAAL